MVDYTSGTPVSGLTVTLGMAPNGATCNGAQTQALNVCGVVASTITTTTTAADGSFSLTAPAGTYMLTIGPANGSYATLHRTVTLTAGVADALGTIKLTALDATLQGWLADVNNQRLTVSYPTSFANLTVDEYAQEEAQADANAVAAGTAPYGDAGYTNTYMPAYSASPGAMYSPGAVSAELQPGQNVEYADFSWMNEKITDCGAYNGNWQTCPFSLAGHYINMSNTQDVWVGLGTSATLMALGGYPTSIMIVMNLGSVGPQ